MPRELQPCVYILASRRNGTLYTGVTANLIQRLHQHREGIMPGFTSDYGVKLLVWFEPHATMEHAILREKRIKKWTRQWKVELIERDNLFWRDLAVELGFAPLSPLGPRFRGDDDSFLESRPVRPEEQRSRKLSSVSKERRSAKRYALPTTLSGRSTPNTRW